MFSHSEHVCLFGFNVLKLSPASYFIADRTTGHQISHGIGATLGSRDDVIGSGGSIPTVLARVAISLDDLGADGSPAFC
jgi:hypothetical protein